MHDGWNDNTHYHERLLRNVPRPCARALDVGCGLGTFARRLASVAERVDAVDRDAGVVARARERSHGTPNVRFIEADFLDWPGTFAHYDVVSMIATLHHLPFAATCAKVTRLLRPGGVFIVLGLSQSRSLVELAPSAVAFPASWWYRLTRTTSVVGAPVHDPTMSLDEIRHEGRRELPGAIIRRHLLWRYSLIWTKPSDR